MDRYKDQFFIEKYAVLWAYGYQNGNGISEGLYRTVNELGFASKNNVKEILDVGCGVGRTAADYARFFKHAKVIGIDNSRLMIDMANRINSSDEEINFDMSRLGFDIMRLQGSKLQNVRFFNIELGDFFSEEYKERFDIITAVNFLDRTVDLERDLVKIFQLLKQKSIFIVASPLNFLTNEYRSKYGSFESLSNLVKQVGFRIDVAFDNFSYKEVLDVRGATEEYRTVVMRMVKP